MTQTHPDCLPLAVSESGWLEPVRQLHSPNFGPRPVNCAVNLLVIHNISLPPDNFGGGYIESFFLNELNHSEHPYFETIRDVRVSAHCLIDRNGMITQFVSFFDRAWHAGQSCFDGISDCNDFSIGIELEGSDNTAYTSRQYYSLAHLTKLIMKTFENINLSRIVGHSDIAPKRKTDPGPAFDWNEYRGLLGVKTCI